MNNVKVTAEVNVVEVAGSFVYGNDICFLLEATLKGLEKYKEDEFARYNKAKIEFLLKQAEKFKWKEKKNAT
jgi:hypothetical protein